MSQLLAAEQVDETFRIRDVEISQVGGGGKAASGGAAGQTDSFPGAFPDKLFPLPTQVTIMGIIRHAEKAPTNILYKVDDMTAAPMDVRQWVDTDVSIRFVMDTLL